MNPRDLFDKQLFVDAEEKKLYIVRDSIDDKLAVAELSEVTFEHPSCPCNREGEPEADGEYYFRLEAHTRGDQSEGYECLIRGPVSRIPFRSDEATSIELPLYLYVKRFISVN